MLIIPTFTVCYTFFSVFAGGFFFDEFVGFGSIQWSIFPISVLITFVGIYFIGIMNKTDDATSEDLESICSVAESFGFDPSGAPPTDGLISKGLTSTSVELQVRHPDDVIAIVPNLENSEGSDHSALLNA